MTRTQFPNKVPQPMPGNVRGALQKAALMDAYLDRPTYQKDDYLKWIATAAGPTAKQQRIDQMIEELQKGGVFKGEPWTPPPPVAKPAAAPSAAATPASKPAAKPAAKAAATPASKPAAKPAAKAAATPAAKPAAKK